MGEERSWVKSARYPQRFKVIHRYYNQTGFYSFVGLSVKKCIPYLCLILVGLYLVNKYVFDFEDGLQYVVRNFNSAGILMIFLSSESFLGLLPPEVFIAWSSKTSNPVMMLSLLALCSYLGGLLSYFIGWSIQKVPVVHNYFENKMANHLKNARKWGGFLIVVGALLPLPFSIASIAAGMIRFKFVSYLIFGSLRFVRFYIYAIAIFQMV